MIAVDTHILVCAHRMDSPFHEQARSAVEWLAAGLRPWAIPWPSAREFFAIVKQLRIFRTATPPATAFTQLAALHALPPLAFISEGDDHLARLRSSWVAFTLAARHTVEADGVGGGPPVEVGLGVRGAPPHRRPLPVDPSATFAVPE